MEHFSQNITNSLLPFFDCIVAILNIFSIIVLIIGAICTAISFIKNELSNNDRLSIVQQIGTIKSVLGSYILLSLEILIAADIIESIIKPTFEDLLTLAILVVIRTFISYFLNQEIEELISQNHFNKKKSQDDSHPAPKK